MKKRSHKLVDAKRIAAGRAKFKVPKFTKVSKISWRASYRHPNWLQYKAQILKRDRYMCRRCKTEKRKLHVHHKRYTKPFIWSSPPKDLITLCSKCHKLIHATKSKK